MKKKLRKFPPGRKKGSLTARLEDYLETISLLDRTGKGTRVKDIGRLLKVRNSSVVSALNTLVRNGLVKHAPYGKVLLTGKGYRQAQSIIRKHSALFVFLRDILGLDKGTAENDACLIEHVVSPDTLRKLTKLVRSYGTKGSLHSS